MTPLRPVGPELLKRVWRLIAPTSLFADLAVLECELRDRPYRVLAAGQKSDLKVVVTRPWRVGRKMLAVQYVACAAPDRLATVAAIAPAARRAGFDDVLSPMLSDTDAQPFLANGYAPRAPVLLMAATTSGRKRTFVPAGLPDGVTLRAGGPQDVDAIVKVDGTAFDEFWGWGAGDVSEAMSKQTTWVAEDEASAVVGYTMGSVAGRQGNLVRLAVSPSWRRRGVASGLVSALASDMRRRRAARVLLCTQSENSASRRLYEGLGFAQLGPELTIYARGSENTDAS